MGEDWRQRLNFLLDFSIDLTVYYAPISGMPLLAYLGQMLQKGGRFAITIFPRGWYLLSKSTKIAYTFSFAVKCLWKNSL